MLTPFLKVKEEATAAEEGEGEEGSATSPPLPDPDLPLQVR